VPVPLPDNVAAAIRYCLTQGRAGRGIPILWAVGNGAETISTDGYASNPDVIAVGASTEKDERATYSSFGDELWICAPSSGSHAAGERAITTTDRTGGYGYNPTTEVLDVAELADTSYTNGFGGTSSAAPFAAGVAALILSANPALTAQEVRDILGQTADKVGANPYDAVGRNQMFGFGRVNAEAAVAEAMRRIGQAPAPVHPPPDFAIVAPDAMLRSDPPPSFRVTVPAGRFHAIEVTTDPALFRAGAGGRTADTFFATWAAGTLLESPNYSLPATTWQALRQAPALFYRLIVSDSRTGWTNVRKSVADADGASAPRIAIADTNPTGPKVAGPARIERSGAAPSLRADPRPRALYAVEIASDPSLFDPAQAAARQAANYFATWTRSPSFIAQPDYSLPDDVWQQLRASAALFYRIWGNDAAGRWHNGLVSNATPPYPTIQIVD
jgi:hypothetical protein